MITNLIERTLVTALKLPIAAAWDCISLGNMGEGASTLDVLRDHERQKRIDEEIELAQRIAAIRNQ